MTMSTNTLLLSIVCVVCGVVLGYLQPGNPMGGILVAAGVTALGVSNYNARNAAEKERGRADTERQRADKAMNQTASISLEALRKLPPKDQP